MNRAITKTYRLTQEYRAYITQVLIFGSILFAVLYALNMYLIVTRTVAAHKVEGRATSLSKSIQDLETRYIALSGRITPDMAKEFGLHETDVSEYIPRVRTLGSAHTLANDL